MDRRERFNDLPTALLMALRGWQKEIWTALPGVVEEYFPNTMTCSIQSALLIPVTQPDGSTADVKMPLLLDVPIVFPTGGGFSLTFPIAKGDEVLVIFASRCINTWWAKGGVDNRLEEYRFHDLSDGFAIPGPYSQPKRLTGLSSNSVQLRSNSGNTYVEVKDGAVVNVVAPGGVTITAPTIALNGNVTSTGTATFQGEGTFNNHSVGGHTHGGVQPGGGTTGLPTG